MKFCMKCGAEFPVDDAAFCPECGRPASVQDGDDHPRLGHEKRPLLVALWCLVGVVLAADVCMGLYFGLRGDGGPNVAGVPVAAEASTTTLAEVVVPAATSTTLVSVPTTAPPETIVGDDAGTQDLVMQGLGALESAYVEFGAFDSGSITPEYLHASMPSVEFVLSETGDTPPALRDVPLASTRTVAYQSTAQQCFVQAASTSGNVFAVMLDKSDGSSGLYTYYVNNVAQFW